MPRALALGASLLLASMLSSLASTSELVGTGFRKTLTMKSGESVRYQIHLEAGEIVQGAADQDGIDVVVNTYDPSGAKIGSVDSPNGTKGPEPFTIRAKTAGDYTVEIKPLDAGYGKVTVHIDALVSKEAYADQLFAKAYPAAPVAELVKAMRTNGPSAFDVFAAKYKGHFPIITPRKDDDKDITFFFKASPKTISMSLQGPAFANFETPMQRLASTDIWYVTVTAPKDAQFVYLFQQESSSPDVADQDPLLPQTEKHPALDPLNPVFGAGRNLLKLPGAPPETYSTKLKDVPQGKVVKESLSSKILKENRAFSVYTPSGWNGTTPANLVLVFDGEAYGAGNGALVPTPTILDNLIAKKKIGPTVVILVNNMGLRNRDLTCYQPFADFLAKELVPWVKKHYAISGDPHRTVVAGSSFGGICSAYAGLKYPNVFGSVLSQSGSYWFYPNWATATLANSQEQSLIKSYFDSKRLPLNIYMEVGILEGDSMVQSNRRMRDILRLKGYPITYREYTDAHDYQTWRESLADGLIALLGKKR